MINTIVVGSLTTDFVITGLDDFPKVGGIAEYAKGFKILPGGKSRNVAEMIGHLTQVDSVAMVGRTVKDAYDLWRVPVDALTKCGVNTDYVNIVDGEQHQYPDLAFAPVRNDGNHQFIIYPGAREEFSSIDIDNAQNLFELVGKNNGVMIATLDTPMKTISYAIQKAKDHGLKVMLDPGGVRPEDDLKELLSLDIYLIKPNEHEIEILTGIEVNDFISAQKAAHQLMERGIAEVFITVGSKGAYFFNDIVSLHIPIPNIESTQFKDQTGCGDQVMAAYVAMTQSGYSLEEALHGAIRAGTLQFYRSGVVPVKRDELFQD